ncbi:hypothetical protein Hanom_Chr10g00892861 [Helianthus anomalus]
MLPLWEKKLHFKENDGTMHFQNHKLMSRKFKNPLTCDASTTCIYMITHLPPYVARCLELSFLIGFLLLCRWQLRFLQLILFISRYFSPVLQFASFLYDILSFLVHNGTPFLII